MLIRLVMNDIGLIACMTPLDSGQRKFSVMNISSGWGCDAASLPRGLKIPSAYPPGMIDRATSVP
jgi:hypothetical protein